jgi:hypothetical protein
MPRRVFLSLDYAAQKSICEWQLAANDPNFSGIPVIHSSFCIFFLDPAR